MSVVTMKQLLEAGVHFGHHTRRWNPKMRSYIFTERNGIHIIDLRQTLEGLNEAYETVQELTSQGGSIMFVGTKKQAAEIVKQAATECGMPYVTHRWLGGTMTNWQTIRQRIDYLLELEQRQERGEFSLLPKKEVLQLEREMEKLNTRLGGIKDMRELPDVIFVVDTRREDIAVKEANILEIPIIAMVDTNSDPDRIDYVIPSNDDAIRTIKLITGLMAQAAGQGRLMRASAYAEEMEEEELAAVDTTQRIFEPDEFDFGAQEDEEPDAEEDEEHAIA
ncbi:MAG: 30S ribosomal protein S2 [Anaerolineales bacterium]|nr:30S ribosomal protein S2 [Anaerolineales bacterium]